MEITSTLKAPSDFISHGTNITLVVTTQLDKKTEFQTTFGELILMALANELGHKIVAYLNEKGIALSSFEIKASGEPGTDFKNFSLNGVSLSFSYKEKEIKSNFLLNAIEFSLYSSIDLATLIGQTTNVRWIAYNNESFLGDGIARYYDPNNEENENPIS